MCVCEGGGGGGGVDGCMHIHMLGGYSWCMVLTIPSLHKIFPMIVTNTVLLNLLSQHVCNVSAFMLCTQNACSTLMFPSQSHCL